MKQFKNLNVPRIIGHRGVKDLAPENTLESIIEAFRIGLKWIEVDVKISKDNIPFLLHDDDFDRTTNGTGTASSYNYSQIKKLDAGKFFYKKDTKIYPPTLKEVLSLCQKNKGGINIELKPNLGLEKKNVEEILKITKKFEEYVPLYFSSFDLDSCIFVKEVIPSSSCGILIHDFNYYSFEEIIKITEKFNFFSCGLSIKIINTELVKKLKNMNQLITVFSEKNITNEQALDLWNIGVDSIFSDDPRDILFNFNSF